MPKIEEFANRVDLQANDRGEQAFQQEGRHVEAAYGAVDRSFKQIGQDVAETGQEIDTHITQQQQQTTLATKVQMRASVLAKMHEMEATDAAAPTHDPHLYDKIMQMAGEHYDALDSGFSTRRGQQWWAADKAEEMGHISEHAQAATATNAGLQNEIDSNRFSSALQFTAHQDPASMPANVKDIETWTTNQLGLLKGGDATPENISRVKLMGEKMKEAAWLQAADGAISSAAPGKEQAALAMVMGMPGATDSLGPHAANLGKLADEQARTNQEKAKAAALQDKQKLEMDGKQYFADLRAKAFDPATGDYHPTPELVQAAKDGAHKYGSVLEGESASMLNSLGEAQRRLDNHEVVSTQWDRFDSLSRGAITGQTTQAQVDQAYIDKKLSNAEYSHLTEQVKRINSDPNEKELQKRLETFITTEQRSILGGVSKEKATPARLAAYYAFDSALRSGIDAARARGVSANDIMNTALNPADKQHFFGYDQGIMGHIQNIVHPSKAGMVAQAQHGPIANTPAGRAAAGAADQHAVNKNETVSWDGKESPDQLLSRINGGH